MADAASNSIWSQCFETSRPTFMSYNNTPNVLLKNFFGCSIEQDVPILSPPAAAKADRDTLLFQCSIPRIYCVKIQGSFTTVRLRGIKSSSAARLYWTLLSEISIFDRYSNTLFQESNHVQKTKVDHFFKILGRYKYRPSQNRLQLMPRNRE